MTDWRPVLDALPDAAMALDGQRRVAAFNAKAAEIFPQVSEGLLFSAINRNPLLLSGLASVRGGDPISIDIEERWPVERTLKVTIAALPDGGRLLTFRDLSEARSIERMRTDFIANASHELRTPLASIIGFIETLQGPAKDDPGARERFLGVMGAQAQRMKRLVDDLMSLSRVEMHAHVRPRGQVDLAGVLTDVVAAMEPVAERDGTAIALDLPPLPALVEGDREELTQAFQNLVHNAIRHGRENGRITVKLTQVAGGWEASVADDGPGIAPYHLPRLTERFYRVDADASRRKEGTGLGLAIVKHIVQRHRGELTIRSQLGSGSEFRISVPTRNA